MARVVLKNTFLSLDSVDYLESQVVVPRRRAFSESPSRPHHAEGNAETSSTTDRLSKLLDLSRREQAVPGRSAVSKLPLASHLTLSSLASLGLHALQLRLEEAGAEGCLEPARCASVRSPVASSECASTAAPDDSDGSESMSAAASRSDASLAGSARPRGKLATKGRREKSRPAMAWKQQEVAWAYPDMSQLCAGGTWLPYQDANAAAESGSSAWELWRQQQVEAASAWMAVATAN